MPTSKYAGSPSDLHNGMVRATESACFSSDMICSSSFEDERLEGVKEKSNSRYYNPSRTDFRDASCGAARRHQFRGRLPTDQTFTFLPEYVSTKKESTDVVSLDITYKIKRPESSEFLQWLISQGGLYDKQYDRDEQSVIPLICKTRNPLSEKTRISGLSLHILPCTQKVHRWRHNSTLSYCDTSSPAMARCKPGDQVRRNEKC
jgi:hypothetical protein